MHSFEDALNLIDYSRAGFNLLKLEYGYCTDIKTVTSGLPIMIKNFLDNARSALDFSTNALYQKFGDQSKPPPTIHFPYAWVGATEMEFEKKVDINLPGIKIKRPDLYEVLNSYQYYISDDNVWLPEFMELISDNRYADLAIEPMDEVDQLVGDFGIQGAGLVIRGEGTIEMGGSATIESKYGSIKGEQTISMQSAAIKHQQGAVKTEINKHVLIYFESNNQEVIAFLDEILHNVSIIISDLAGVARLPYPRNYS
jgi:hypothetical protein